MNSGPSRIAEGLVTFLILPACREEVVGDLHERFESPWQYPWDAIRTLPRVVVSRIRRVADPQVLTLHSFALYLSFSGAAWLMGEPLLASDKGPWRIAILVVMMILGLLLSDAYAYLGTLSRLDVARGPLAGLVLALVSQAMLSVSRPVFVLPRWILCWGCAWLYSCVPQ